MPRTLSPLLLLLPLLATAQDQYVVTPVDLAPGGVDFAPVLVDSMVVMCSLRDEGTVVVRDAETGDPLSDLYSFNWQEGHPSSPVLLSRDLKSEVNDGPASFSMGGTTICFTRNQLASTRKKDGQADRLGLFFAAQGERDVRAARGSPGPGPFGFAVADEIEGLRRTIHA